MSIIARFSDAFLPRLDNLEPRLDVSSILEDAGIEEKSMTTTDDLTGKSYWKKRIIGNVGDIVLYKSDKSSYEE
jgi:hypothetical protein